MPQTLKDTILWLAIILAFGGAFTFLIAHFWTKTARVLRFFDLEVSSARAEKLTWGGAAAFIIGLAVLFLFIKMNGSRSYAPHGMTRPAATTQEE